jgi:hypothetical protein
LAFLNTGIASNSRRLCECATNFVKDLHEWSETLLFMRQSD